MDFLLGMNAKVYFGPAGTALATLTELTNVQNVTLSLTAGESDVTTRANQGWRATAPTLREASVDFTMMWKPGDAGFAAVKAAFLASSTLALAVLTGDKATSDTEGPRGDWSITNFTRNEPLEEGITVDVTAKLSTFAEWVDVA